MCIYWYTNIRCDFTIRNKAKRAFDWIGQTSVGIRLTEFKAKAHQSEWCCPSVWSETLCALTRLSRFLHHFHVIASLCFKKSEVLERDGRWIWSSSVRSHARTLWPLQASSQDERFSPPAFCFTQECVWGLPFTCVLIFEFYFWETLQVFKSLSSLFNQCLKFINSCCIHCKKKCICVLSSSTNV